MKLVKEWRSALKMLTVRLLLLLTLVSAFWIQIADALLAVWHMIPYEQKDAISGLFDGHVPEGSGRIALAIFGLVTIGARLIDQGIKNDHDDSSVDEDTRLALAGAGGTSGCVDEGKGRCLFCGGKGDGP